MLPTATRNTLACNDPARGRDMPKKSHLRTLAPELRDELDRLLRDGRHTIRQVTDHLRALGVQTSKSSVHEYSQEFERVMEDVRRTREFARAVGAELVEVGQNSA